MKESWSGFRIAIKYLSFILGEDSVLVSFQFDEQKDQVAVEQILRVVFLDVERPTPVRVFYSLIYTVVWS